MELKIGDKVRFINECGGGIVKGFRGKDTVLVEDGDGFEIPMTIGNCVAVETDRYNFERKSVGEKRKPQRDEQPSAPKQDDEKTPAIEELKPLFIPERREGEKLNVFLCFAPVDIREISTTVIETYLVNDSNYALAYTYCTIGSGNLQLRSTGIVEPNTKLFIEEFTRDKLNEMEHLNMRLIPYKTSKPFLRKPICDVDVRLDPVKFFKLHTFADSPFFAEPVLTIKLVINDEPK